MVYSKSTNIPITFQTFILNTRPKGFTGFTTYPCVI